MKAEIKEKVLYIEIPIEERESSTKKTILIACSGGFQPTDARYKNKVVSVNITATVKP